MQREVTASLRVAQFRPVPPLDMVKYRFVVSGDTSERRVMLGGGGLGRKQGIPILELVTRLRGIIDGSGHALLAAELCILGQLRCDVLAIAGGGHNQAARKKQSHQSQAVTRTQTEVEA
jgi:hypothetical protein